MGRGRNKSSKKSRPHRTSSGLTKGRRADRVKKDEERRKARSERFLKLKAETKARGMNPRAIKGNITFTKLRLFLSGKSIEEINGPYYERRQERLKTNRSSNKKRKHKRRRKEDNGVRQHNSRNSKPS